MVRRPQEASRDPRADARVVRRWASRGLADPRSGLVGPSASFASPSSPLPDDDWSQELPGPGVELVIELDGRWDLEIDGGRTRTGAFAAGLVAGPARTRAVGAVRLVQLCLDPLAVLPVLGVPAGEIAAAAVPLDALLGGRAPELLERLDTVFVARPPGADDPQRAAVALAEAWVRRRLHESGSGARPSVPADVRRACALLRASGGLLRTEALAAELGCSRRHLARRFATHVGVPPSAFARLVRFERASEALRREPRRHLGALAFDAGYADHAHMVRDFHALGGATPSAVAARLAA